MPAGPFVVDKQGDLIVCVLLHRLLPRSHTTDCEEAIIRETLEETGYRINKPELICKFFSSPGGTSERIFLYFSEVSEVDRVGAGGGVHGKDVRVVRRCTHELFAQLEKRQIEDPKLAIGAYCDA